MNWVGKHLAIARIVPAISSNPAYSVNDCVGTLNTITNAVTRRSGGGQLIGAVLSDAASQIGDHAIEALFFWANPTSSTFTDNAVFTIADADVSKFAFGISFSQQYGAEHFASSTNQYAQRTINFPYEAQTDTIYVVLKTRGTPTFSTTSDLVLNLIFERY